MGELGARRIGIAGEAIRPHVRDLHLDAVLAGLDEACDLDSERRSPAGARILAVDLHTRDHADVPEVEEDALAGEVRRHVNRLAIGGYAGEVANAGVVIIRPGPQGPER